MKSLKFLLIAVFCLFIATGSQAYTPDQKKNSKIEFTKQSDVGVQFNVVLTKNVNFTVEVQKASKPEATTYKENSQTLKPDNIVELLIDSGGVKRMRPVNYNKATENYRIPNKNILLHRLSRDGFVCSLLQ